MKNSLIASICAAAVLAGCQATDTKTSAPTTPNTKPTETQRFECENGISVAVSPAGTSRRQLTIISHQNATAILNHTPSASGERYVNTEGFFGHGGEWHQKASTAYFTFTDATGASIGVSCEAL